MFDIAFNLLRSSDVPRIFFVGNLEFKPSVLFVLSLKVQRFCCLPTLRFLMKKIFFLLIFSSFPYSVSGRYLCSICSVYCMDGVLWKVVWLKMYYCTYIQR